LNDFIDNESAISHAILWLHHRAYDDIMRRSSESEHFSALNRRFKRKLNQNDAIESTFSILLLKKAGCVNAWRGKN